MKKAVSLIVFLSMTIMAMAQLPSKQPLQNIDTINSAASRQSVVSVGVSPCVLNAPQWHLGGDNLGNGNPPRGYADYAIGTCDNNDFILKANGNKSLWVKPSGNIGIGTFNPLVKLDVNGSLKIQDLSYSSTALPLDVIQGAGQSEGIKFTGQSYGKTAFEVDLSPYLSISRFLIFGSGQTYIGNFSNLMNNYIVSDPYLTIGQPTKANKAFTIVDNTNPGSLIDYFTVYGDGRTEIKTVPTLSNKALNIIDNSIYTAPEDKFTVYGDGRTEIKTANASDKVLNIIDNSIPAIPKDLFTVYGSGKTEIKTAVLNEGLTITQTGAGASALYLNNTTTNGHHWAIFSTGINNAQGAGHFSIYDYNAGVDRLFISNTGNIGIGTITPGDKLQVGDTWQKIAMGSAAGKALAYGTSYLGFNASRRNLSSWTISGDGYHNGGSVILGDINGNIYFSAIPSTGAVDQNLSDSTIMSNSNFRIRSNGSVLIGPKMPIGTHSDFRLAIDGKIVATSCYITIADWADYVFDANYELPNLYDVEAYYKANKHLPEIPSEKEIIANGVDIAGMNKLLLMKIEELTILMVNQQKEIDLLKQEMNK